MDGPQVAVHVVEAHSRGKTGGQRPLLAEGLADAEQLTRQEAEVEAASVNQQPFEDVVVLPQIRAPVFHVGDLRLGIPRMPPVCVRRRLLAPTVDAREGFARQRLDP